MDLFIDTQAVRRDRQFPDLVSIGFVSADGQSFYAERSGFDLDGSDERFRSDVLPYLRAPGALVLSDDVLRLSVSDFLHRLARTTRLEFSYARMIEFDILFETLRAPVPSWMGVHDIRAEVDTVKYEDYFGRTGRPRHHALYGAYANAYAMGHHFPLAD